MITVKEVLHTRMDHLGAMLDGDLDDFVGGEISSNWSILSTLANDVCLVGLCLHVSNHDKRQNQRGKSRILCLCMDSRSS